MLRRKDDNGPEQARAQMVETQLRARDITDAEVLRVMGELPREEFVPPEHRWRAYADGPLAIGAGQTISQPYIVALMTQVLRVGREDEVLEIGTGSGYQTAILAKLAKNVFSVERIDELRQEAAQRLIDLNLTNVTLVTGDGSLGLAAFAPYDCIIVTAAAPTVPESLVRQLADKGRLVLPVGGASEQTIVRVVRDGERTIETPMLPCRFVKLIGEEGWSGGGLFGR